MSGYSTCQAPGRSETLQILDHTQGHGYIHALDVELRVPPGAKVKWNRWRHSAKETGKRFGIRELNMRTVVAKPPFHRDPEIQLWPPLDYELPPYQQPPEMTPRESAELAAEREARRRALLRVDADLASFTRAIARDKAHYDEVSEHDTGVVAWIADLLGGAYLPSAAEWAQIDVDLTNARYAESTGDSHEAARLIKKADDERRSLMARVDQYEEDTDAGARLAIRVLETVRFIGQNAANLVPGALGKALVITYEIVQGPPKTLEELVDRLGGLKPQLSVHPRQGVDPTTRPGGGGAPRRGFAGGEVLLERTRSDGVTVIRSRVGRSPGRLGLEDHLPPGVEVDLAGWERAHSHGNITGAESGQGIRYAPREVNQHYQRLGIERAIRDLFSQKRSNVEVIMTTETSSHPGTLRLSQIVYRIDLVEPPTGRSLRVYEASLEVANAKHAPKITVPMLDPIGWHLLESDGWLKPIR